ncbi:hypothetical protein [Leptolyngbya sp. GGD]|uniref:hypothetical protein n=1 Tax=Leptolyngbya sp. GGD TaxID=2997907 RepID=UPI00227BF14F|nr:hypothetical protein [Leptolyngbya sp. GGD]MCY6494329.1 hypothetical protein [Leptolyngbya sp. GGD]
MLEIAAATLAQTAIGFLLGKAAEGALQTAGSDAYKTALQKLKGFFDYKFGDKQELANANSCPDALIKIVEQELKNDPRLAEDLGQLVAQLQQITGESPTMINQGSNSNAIVDSAVSNSDLSDNSINASSLQASNNSGTISIGNRESSFRNKQ